MRGTTEAFVRVNIDALLKDAGWDLTDGSSVMFEYALADGTQADYTGQLPVVLFGDHTRAFKYVDFPFAMGADGVKVLVPQAALICRTPNDALR